MPASAGAGAPWASRWEENRAHAQKTRKSRASCRGSTTFSTVRSMARTCSGEAVRKASGPMRCSTHEWHRYPPLFSFLLLCRVG